jgi:lysophospholipase L1-like esterase
MNRTASGLLGAALATAMLCPDAQAADGRLKAVMQRLNQGQPVTLATIGGSITTGYAADPPREKGWAAQIANRLGRHGPVTFINAGCSGTDSAAAAQRVKAHVLDAAPDLVIVEFGVNDEWLDPAVRARSYEGLLRQLLSASKPPAVVTLQLTQRGNQPRHALEPQRELAAHYGLTSIDFGAWMQRRVDAGLARWEALYDEPVHPNQRGHDAIAEAVIETLEGSIQEPTTPAPAALPAPLFGLDYQFVHEFAGEALKPWRNGGFERGGDVHPEWAGMPGGQAPGWTTTHDDAHADFLVWGSQISIFHAQSEHYRDLEAWIDDGPLVTLHGHVAERQGYLGWHVTPVGLDVAPGAHLLHIRVKRDDGFAGSGRVASFISVMSAGLLPPALQAAQPGDFEAIDSPATGATDRWIAADDDRLRYVGRTDTRVPNTRGLSWSGTELRARFSGTQLGLRMLSEHGINYFDVEVDGRSHRLVVQGDAPREWRLREALPAGEHELRVVKRTEGLMAEARLLGLHLGIEGELLSPPPPRSLRLEFYGDSITAGACNGDMGADQYDDLSTHDGTHAYGALTARRLGADYVGIAVSGIGITRTWGDLLMAEIWDRVAPHANAPLAPTGAREPDVVLVNLGQNDHGFPAAHGEPFAQDFAPRYLDFVRRLRHRYPHARLVLLIGGMTAWREEPKLLPAIHAAAQTLHDEGDGLVWTYAFDASAYAHPRIDVHQQMSEELVAFLKDRVLP